MLPAPFLAAFGTLMFILLMQFLMRRMSEFIGKGLSAWVIFEIIAYNLAYMMVLAVPMSALIATLFVFGRMSESGYYRVIKASGISLFQLVWPVLLAASVLGVAMKYVNNQLLPESNFRAKSLFYDIRASKPAFALEEGIFYEGVDGYAIRASSINQLTASLEGITVFDYSDDRRGRVTLSARSGRLDSHNHGLMIDLILEDGELHRYRDREDDESYERLRFAEYKVPLDLRDLAFERSDLTATTRSDRTTPSTEMIKLVRNLEKDVVDKRRDAADFLKELPQPDTANVYPESTPILTALTPPDTSLLAVLEHVTPRIREHRSRIQELASTTVWASRRANRFRVEIHKKFSIGFACIVFVLIGIPLGLRVRRGGIGVVAALSVAIFLIYWISLVQGEKLADRGFLDPWIGMWAANVVIGTGALIFFWIVAKDLKHRRVRKPAA